MTSKSSKSYGNGFGKGNRSRHVDSESYGKAPRHTPRGERRQSTRRGAVLAAVREANAR